MAASPPHARSPRADSEAQRRRRWPQRIVIGRVVKPHGVRGEVALEAWGELGRHLKSGVELALKGSGAGRAVTAVRGASGRLIGTIDGCSDRDRAETLRGSLIEISSDCLPLPRGDEFYLFELEGCAVADQQGDTAVHLGVVTEVIEDGGGLLLEVLAAEDEASATSGERKTYTVPFVSAYLEALDFAAGTLTFSLPEGLLDTCVSTS